MGPKRTITSDEKAYLMSLKPNDITLTLLQELFAIKYDMHTQKEIPPKFNTYDEFSLKKGEYFNKEDIKTTNCGLFILNKYLFEEDLSDITGYVNEPFNGDVISKFRKGLDTALLEDKITTDTYIKFLNRLAWIAFSFNTEVSTSLSIHSMKELPAVKKAKTQMIKDNKDAFEEGGQRSVDAAVKMEKDLIAIAKKEMENDDAMELYESGARGAFNVAYKNSQIMKGPSFNSSKNEWEIMFNPLATGIEKDNIPVLANSLIDSSYSVAISTAGCGYLTKKISAAYQAVQVDKLGTDCGTKMYATVELTKDNLGYYEYGYIMEGSKLVRLDPSNHSKYIGKTVKMRSSEYCIGKKICNRCAGDRYQLIGIENIGLTGSKISNTMLNLRTKAKHDSTVNTYHIDIDRDFI